VPAPGGRAYAFMIGGPLITSIILTAIRKSVAVDGLGTRYTVAIHVQELKEEISLLMVVQANYMVIMFC